MKINRKNYMASFIKIDTKDGSQKNFIMNEPQLRLYNKIRELEKENKPVRIIVLKARQMGFSTFTSALFTTDTVTNTGRRSVVVAHTSDSTKEIFEKYRAMVQNLPDLIVPTMSNSNAQEIVFDTKEKTGIGSKIRCMTAGGEGIGRGSTIHNLHLSEYAFWNGDKQAILTGLLQAVPFLPNTNVIIESTANGMEHFKELWDLAADGKSDFVPFFCAWYEMKDYRMKVPDNFKYDHKLEEEEVKKQFNLDDEQIVWRRWCIMNNCHGSLDQFHQEYPSTPEEAFLSTGSSVFNKKQIIDRIDEIRDIPPVKQGYFIYNKQLIDAYNVEINNIRWIDDKKGEIKIFQEPKNGVPYAIGCDTAGAGSDYFASHCIDNMTGIQVAVYHKQKVDEDLFADQMYCLGRYYNDALIGVEANFSTVAIRKLTDLCYPNQYVREVPDTMLQTTQKKYGFLTTVKTRPMIIGDLVEIVREDISKINDIDTLREMLDFIRNEDGRPEAEVGKHDDLVMSLAITHYISSQQVNFKTENVVQSKGFVASNFHTNNYDDEGGYAEW